MAREYKVTQVSSEAPREWQGPNGTVFYIKVKLEGHPKPVTIGKKSPDALKASDTVYGTIISDPNRNEDKFKAEQNPHQSSGGYSSGKSSATGSKTFDERAMYVSYAKDIAVALINQGIIPGTEDFTDYMLYTSGSINRTAEVLKEGEPVSQFKVNDDLAAAIDMFAGAHEDEDF
jgi:hypothetical protein